MTKVEGLYREGEYDISLSWFDSFDYAKYFLKGRFIAGESTMKISTDHWNAYVEFLKNKGIKI